MILIESNNTIAKLGCYLLIGSSVIGSLLIMSTLVPHQNHNDQWAGILIVLLIGGFLPRWYLSTLKCYRLTLTKRELLLEEIPDTLVSRQPLTSLVGWWVASSHRSSSARYLHFDFKHSGRIYILDKEYVGFDQLVTYLQIHHARKNFTGRR